ncbi:hypothetical protein J2772_000772 [Chryseobacterium jejuense]|nr:hypothetical protein [Chryseobacterium jejuense]
MKLLKLTPFKLFLIPFHIIFLYFFTYGNAFFIQAFFIIVFLLLIFIFLLIDLGLIFLIKKNHLLIYVEVGLIIVYFITILLCKSQMFEMLQNLIPDAPK